MMKQKMRYQGVKTLMLALSISSGFAQDARFERQIRPMLEQYCIECHNAEKMKSGIRVDHLDGGFDDRQLRLWDEILKQVVRDEAMPPEDEDQLSATEREQLGDWIQQLLIEAKSRDVDRNGSIRRLTVAQYRNTLKDLLGIEDDLTGVLPPDAVSRDGFLNNEQTMLLSPILLETFFEIAERALDLCIVDPNEKPIVQHFRMDLGQNVNPKPLPENLILGASSRLLPNAGFQVIELAPKKPFQYEPFRMQTKLRFIEGYAGNSTVRGWREYDSIYHTVFACMRGNGGYPIGNPYDLVPEGLLLRPAIPSVELFGVESTYGPKANFKVSLRELPDTGKFRVTVRAAKYDDGLMLDSAYKPIGEGIVAAGTKVEIEKSGIYQVEVYLAPPQRPEADDSNLTEGLIGEWNFNDGSMDSPFGKAIKIDSDDSVVVIPRNESMNVGEGDFSVAAWIRPAKLSQGGIVALGPYGKKGWVFDMPGGGGVLRIETFWGPGQHNGTVRSEKGALRRDVWQHVAAVVKRGENKTKLFVNGFEVGTGTIEPANLDNHEVDLHIGRIPNAQVFSGEIDEVRIYNRALDVAEIQALVNPGATFVFAPPEGRKNLTLRLGNREFSGRLDRTPFVAVRLPEGPLDISTDYAGSSAISNIIFAPMENPTEFERFEARSPNLGVHLGLRRDCGSTLNRVGSPRVVSNTLLNDFVFEGAIANFPSPDVEKDNVNYISGLREIGVRSEFTDGRDMPRLLIRSVEFEGPYYETWPPETHRRIFVNSDPREVIRTFATRAFRRPITKEEETAFMKIYDRSSSIKETLVAVLTSPQFLFLIESSQGPEAEDINDWELASKLAYFLWNSPPDDHLLTLAASGKLRDSLDSEVARLIADKRFLRFTEAFTSQWLNLDKLDIVETDRKLFPRLTRDTKTELRAEPVRFLEYLIRENMPLRHLIDAEYIVGNEIVAAYYDLGERTESGFVFEPIRHGQPGLGGVLGQAGILAALSNGRESNPVKRGAWFARKIIAEPPDDPPPNVPAIDEEDHTLTLREKLEQHRNQVGCRKCHEGIDPWGLPFESFDAGGRFKLGEEIDAASVLPDKTKIGGFYDLKRYLANERLDAVRFSLLKHLASYAVGRDLSYKEVEFLRAKSVEFQSDDDRMQNLIQFIVQSDIFLKK